jgi:hypothetical protein
MKPPPPSTLHLEVLRAFWLAGSVQPVGARLELPTGLAVDLLNAHKARVVPAETQPGAPDATAPETPAKPAASSRRKERT